MLTTTAAAAVATGSGRFVRILLGTLQNGGLGMMPFASHSASVPSRPDQEEQSQQEAYPDDEKQIAQDEPAGLAQSIRGHQRTALLQQKEHHQGVHRTAWPAPGSSSALSDEEPSLMFSRLTR